MVSLFVQRATAVALSIVAILVFGLSSYLSLPRESTPDIKIPVVIVSTPYIGVAPEDIEGLITIPIENELASLTDVKKMSSSSAEGISVVSIEFEPEVDIDEALQKVRDRVNRAQSKLPSDAELPTVQEVSFSDIPVLLLTIAGGVDEQELKQIAEALEEEVVRLPGVLDADVTGGRERQIRVQVMPERLAFYSLKLADITSALQGENISIPGGNITVGNGTFLVRTPGEIAMVEEISRVAVKRVGDRPVFISDLARVVDTFEDRATYSRMDGEDSVTLSVKKRTGSNILEVAQGVKDLVTERSEAWPAGVRWQVLGDQSEGIEDMVGELQNNIITALILVVAVILMFMGARNSLFVALAIPLSMLMSFLVLDLMGFTLNMVVLFSLILALGMMVDNAIVVVENIYRHVEMGKDPRQAAVDGTNEVAMAVGASTATTVAAFLPLVFWTGIMGQFMGFLPKTVIVVLVSSLAVALFVLPAVTSRLMPAVVSDGGGGDAVLDPATLGPMMRRYHSVLSWAVDHRYLSLVAGVLMLFGSFAAYGVLNHGVEFFPATDPNRATIGLRMPEGADLEATDHVVRLIEGVLDTIDNVEVYVAETGIAASGNALAGSSEQSNAARITVDFLPSADKADPGETVRVESTLLTMLRMRAAFAQIPGAEITVEKEEMGPPVGAPIAVEVSGEDFHVVGAAADALVRELAKVDGTTDLEHDYRVGRPELRLRVDRGAATRVGVSTRTIGSTVRTALSGTKATTLREGEEEYDIMVELAPEYRSDLQRILGLRLPGRKDTSPKTFPVPLSTVASYELAGGSGTIKHIDQDLVVTIQGDVTVPGSENEVLDRVAAVLASWDAPEGVHARIGGASDEQAEAAAFLMWAMGVAVSLILMVLVAQFDSLAMPAIILFTVLLSLIGVLWGLIITGTAFGIIMTGIGVISLAGVVVNNAIVMLDYVQQLEDRGMSPNDAVLLAGVTRFRPVMLTAITTTLGLVPMAIGASIDFTRFSLILGSSTAQFWGPMAVAVIFGLSFATVLTLVMVPTLYAIYVDLRPMMSRIAGRVLGGGAATAAVLFALVWPAEASAVTLEQAIEAAETHNIDLALAREQTVQASTLRWQALSAVMPRLSASMTYAINQSEVELDFGEFGDVGGGEIDPEAFLPLVTHPDSPFTVPFLTDAFAPVFEDAFSFDVPATEPIVVQPKTAWSGNFTIYQPLLNGQAYPAWLAATRIHDAAKADERRAGQQVRGVVAQVFYALATSRKAIALSETALDTAKHQQQLAGRQVDAGLADRRTLLQAELGVSRAERDLASAEERAISAEETFARVTGLPRDSALQAPPPLQVPDDLEAALRDALTKRPDIEATEHRVVASQREKLARDLEWLPSIDFTFSEVYNQVPGFVPQNFQWRIGFNFDWQIFDGGLRIARSRELASQVRSAKLLVEQRQQLVVEQVRTAWSRYERAQAAFRAVSQEITLAAENLRLAELGFQAGSATWLDVDVARLSLAATELALATEEMNRELAVVDLLVATGLM